MPDRINPNPSQARLHEKLARLAATSKWHPAEIAFAKSLIKKHYHARRSLVRAIEADLLPTARRRQHSMLDSFSSSFCAVINRAVSDRVSIAADLKSFREIEKLARTSRPTRPIFEVSKVSAKLKADGSKRVIVSPGFRVRAAQDLAYQVYSEWGLCSPYEYNLKSRGNQAAVAEVIRLIKEVGLHDFVIFDFKNFFSSVEPTHLGWIPLPRETMRNSIYWNKHTTYIGKHDEAKAARQGMATGAIMSGILGSSLLGRNLQGLPGAKGVVTLSDDGIIGASDPADASAIAKALKDRFANLTGGPLSFKHCTVVNVFDGFSFLGYYFRLKSSFPSAELSVFPSHEARKRMHSKLWKHLVNIGPTADVDVLTKRAEKYVTGWISAFNQWSATAYQRETMLAWATCVAAEFYQGSPFHLSEKPNF